MKKSAPLQNNIQAILTERDMSVRELAKKLNLSPAHMARMVNGQSPLTMKYIFKIAEALNVTPVDVVGLNLSKAIKAKYDIVMLGAIMEYLIEEAADNNVPLNRETLTKLTTYIGVTAVERQQLNDYGIRRRAIDAIQVMKIAGE